MTEDIITSNPGREGAAWNVLVIVFDQDAVVSWEYWQVGHSAASILVVYTADVSFGWTLNGQRQAAYKDGSCVLKQQVTHGKYHCILQAHSIYMTI